MLNQYYENWGKMVKEYSLFFKTEQFLFVERIVMLYKSGEVELVLAMLSGELREQFKEAVDFIRKNFTKPCYCADYYDEEGDTFSFDYSAVYGYYFSIGVFSKFVVEISVSNFHKLNVEKVRCVNVEGMPEESKNKFLLKLAKLRWENNITVLGKYEKFIKWFVGKWEVLDTILNRTFLGF